MKTEQLDKTDNDMIFIERDTPLTREEVDARLEILKQALNDDEKLVEAIARVVPTYRAPEEINRLAHQSDEMKLVGNPA